MADLARAVLAADMELSGVGEALDLVLGRLVGLATGSTAGSKASPLATIVALLDAAAGDGEFPPAALDVEFASLNTNPGPDNALARLVSSESPVAVGPGQNAPDLTEIPAMLRTLAAAPGTVPSQELRVALDALQRIQATVGREMMLPGAGGAVLPAGPWAGDEGALADWILLRVADGGSARQEIPAVLAELGEGALLGLERALRSEEERRVSAHPVLRILAEVEHELSGAGGREVPRGRAEGAQGQDPATGFGELTARFDGARDVARLRVFHRRRDRGRKDGEDAPRVALALDMSRLGPVAADLRMGAPDRLSVKVFVRDEAVREHLLRHGGELESGLRALGLETRLEVASRRVPHEAVDATLGPLDPAAHAARVALDVRG
ncbi:MAG: flagellar hook-length control protein FliK [Planctomycetes bacterium]|nr:flagellar hook-length control protein FliK [Planctomycetota bacterium]